MFKKLFGTLAISSVFALTSLSPSFATSNTNDKGIFTIAKKEEKKIEKKDEKKDVKMDKKDEKKESKLEKKNEKKEVKGKIVNINTATEQELKAIPGVGEKIAKEIVSTRTKKGKFKKIEDLKDVKGIGSKTFEKMKSMLAI